MDDVDARDKDQRTPLYHAVKKHRPDAVRALMDSTARDVPDRNGETALGLARRRGYTAIVELIESYESQTK